MKVSQTLGALLVVLLTSTVLSTQPTWTTLSSSTGTLPNPASPKGSYLVSLLVCDIDKDGLNDLVIASYTDMYWYKVTRSQQTIELNRFTVDANAAVDGNSDNSIEAGGTFADIDNDGDIDIIQGGHRRAAAWWWENPAPLFDDTTSWKRHQIMNQPGQCHDQIVGDFDGNGSTELVMWNNANNNLYSSQIPANPTDPWTITTLATVNGDEAEGLIAYDINSDGTADIAGGNHWFFKAPGSEPWQTCAVDAGYGSMSRIAAGRFVTGGEVATVISSGDRRGPLNLYTPSTTTTCGSWTKTTLEPSINAAHTLQIGDINGDGLDDILSASVFERNVLLFYSKGDGTFERTVLSDKATAHEGKLADIDGDGDLDVILKTLAGDDKAALNIFLNNGTAPQTSIKTLPSPSHRMRAAITNHTVTLQGRSVASHAALKQGGVLVRGNSLVLPQQLQSSKE
jgi:hypothetical protein